MEKEINKRKELQSHVISFIDDDNDADNFQALTKFICDNNISKTKIDLQDFLHLLINIADNHHRGVNFFSKIIQIFNYLLPDIRSFFSDKEIWDKFWQNKIIILDIIQNNSIVIDNNMINRNLQSNRYMFLPQFSRNMNSRINNGRIMSPYHLLFSYFRFKSANDIPNLNNIEKIIKKSFDMDIESLQQLCQQGENDNHICHLIRQDSINDFISYFNEKNVKFDSNIPFSAFETNRFLQERSVNLIEYAAFFGSVQIFKYLLKNDVTFDSTLLEFAVHGRNPEIIHLVEDSLNDGSKIKPKRNSFGFNFSHQNQLKGPIGALKESIKCYHNEIADYIEQNGCGENDEEELHNEIIKFGFSFYNYEFIPDDFNLLIPISKYQPKYYHYEQNDDAFQVFYLLTKITIPSSVTKLPNSCFNKMINLKEVVISSSVKEIGDEAFIECSSLELVTILSKLESIGKDAFNRCLSLKEISFPSSLKSIGDKAFNNCSSLKQISIEKNSMLKSIGKNAFANCISLVEVLIPSSLTSIEEGAFMNCIKLSSVSFEEHSIIESLGKSIFAFCSSLTTLTIPLSVTSIGDYSFENCTSLVQLLIPSSITSIGEYSFFQCTSLAQISIPDSVTSIGRCAFESCSSLVQVTISSSLGCINDYLFKNCSSLEQISIPSSVTSIGDYSFDKCSSLKQISFANSVTLIGTGTFEHCTSLQQISIPPSVTSIGDHAFEGCSLLKQIIIPSSVTSIGDYSFRKCTSLETVTISSPLTKIGNFAFSGCNSLPKSQILKDNENSSSNQSDEILKYLQSRKDLYENIFDYLESADKISDNLLEMIQKIAEDEYDLIELLNLLSNISKEATSVSFIHRIEEIIDVCKEKILQKISDNKLCNIFKHNKRILLFLMENKILKLNNSNFNIILNTETKDYNDDEEENNSERSQFYFHPELDQINYQFKNGSKLPENFQIDNEKRRVGENDSEICEIIRNDSVEEFIPYYSKFDQNKNNYLSIPGSSYETNQLLHQVKFIQYAAFYGAIKIFNYLYNKTFNVDSDTSNNNGRFLMEKYALWYFAIHGRQQEIIHILDINGIKPTKRQNPDEYRYCSYSINGLEIHGLDFENCFEESLQCHQNDFARNLIKNNEIDTKYLKAVQSFNFEFIGAFYKKFYDNESFLLYYLCLYDYPKFVQLLITHKNIDLDSFANSHTLTNEHNLRYQYHEDFEQSDKSKIIDAIAVSCSEIVKFFTATNKNIEFDGSSLIQVMQNGDYELLKKMLSQPNISVNNISNIIYPYNGECMDRLTPLFFAIFNHDIEIVNLLLNHPSIDVNISFEPNTSRTTYRTALHIAIEMEYLPVVKMLLERPDIDVNAVANFDDASFNFSSWSNTEYFDFYYTPLHEAVELGNIEIIKLLLAHPKIDVNKIEVFDTFEGKHKGIYDRVRQTVLCRAIQKQDYEIVKLLLEIPGIDVNKQAVFHQNETDDPYHENNNDDDDVDNNDEEEENERIFFHNNRQFIIKRTPLQFAHAGNSEEIIQLLLSRNDIKDEKEKGKDHLIMMFTRGINTNPDNGSDSEMMSD